MDASKINIGHNTLAYDWLQFTVILPDIYIIYLKQYRDVCIQMEQSGELSLMSFKEYMRNHNIDFLQWSDTDFKYKTGRAGKTEESKQTTLGLIITVRGLRLGTLYCLPHDGNILHKTYGAFKLDNQVLYESQDLANYLDTFFSESKIDIQSISRLDLALDFNRKYFRPFFNMLRRAHFNSKYVKDRSDYVSLEKRKQYLKGKYVLKGHTKVLQTNDADNDFIPRGFKLMTERTIKDGKERKTSLSKKVTCYYKSREIEESSGKQYIVKYWKENGLIESEKDHNIQRLEFQVRNTELKKYAEIRTLTEAIASGEGCTIFLEMLFDINFMNALVQRLANDFFEMGKVRSTRIKRGKLTVNYDKDQDMRLELSDNALVRSKAETVRNEFNLRGTSIALKQMLKEYFETKSDHHLENVFEMANNRKMLDYLGQRFIKWCYSLWDDIALVDQQAVNIAYEWLQWRLDAEQEKELRLCLP